MADGDLRHSRVGEMASALAAARSDDAWICEVAFPAQINLRGDPDEPFISSVQQCLGCALPTTPNAVTSGNGVDVLWLGPDEWLIVGPEDTNKQLEQVLSRALDGMHAAVVDVSANRTVIELRGSKAREILGKACGLDLHRHSFRPGQCAQTALAKAQVILQQTGDEPAYRIFVRNSFATYLGLWLIDAASEYRATAAEPL